MRFEDTGFERVTADLNRLDDCLPEFGLIRAEQWDYERVCYDRKFEEKEGVYYLRILGYATEGDVGAHRATIQLLTPIIGKHYYPHGVEYGEDEYFPPSLLKQCESVLAEVKTAVDQFAFTK